MLYTILDHTASPAIQMFMRRFELRMLITPKAYIAMALKHHVCIGAHFYVILHYGTFKPFNGSIKPHEQRYTDRRREGCYIWYSEKGPGGLRRKEGRNWKEERKKERKKERKEARKEGRKEVLESLYHCTKRNSPAING